MPSDSGGTTGRFGAATIARKGAGYVAPVMEAMNVGKEAQDPAASKIEVATQGAEGVGRLGSAAVGAGLGGMVGGPMGALAGGVAGAASGALNARLLKRRWPVGRLHLHPRVDDCRVQERRAGHDEVERRLFARGRPGLQGLRAHQRDALRGASLTMARTLDRSKPYGDIFGFDP